VVHQFIPGGPRFGPGGGYGRFPGQPPGAPFAPGLPRSPAPAPAPTQSG